jgi:hypothetical protein
VKTIIPNPGVNEEWDDINSRMKNIEGEFDQHLKQAMRNLG